MGEWICVESDSPEAEYHNGWARFRCNKCGNETGFEDGEYDWYWGDPNPFLYCPFCGDDKREQHDRLMKELEDCDPEEIGEGWNGSLDDEEDASGVGQAFSPDR